MIRPDRDPDIGPGTNRYRFVARRCHHFRPLGASVRVRDSGGEPAMHDSSSQAPESASLIAARQLAEDAHRRRLAADFRRRRRRPLVVPPSPRSRPPVALPD
jgi:hypothetical protein